MSERDSRELDEILADIQHILGPDPAPPVSDETRRFTPIHTTPKARSTQPTLPWEDPNYTGAYYGPDSAQVVRSAAVTHGRAAPSASSVSAAGRAAEASETERAGEATRQTSWDEDPQARGTKARRGGSAARRYSEPAEEDDAVLEDELPDEEPPRKKHRIRKLLLVLLALIVIAAAAFILLARQPIGPDDHLGARRPGVSTILLAGTDRGNMRTDTLMLLTLDRGAHSASLISIPRDTLVNGPYSVPKINGVYGVNGGGEEGIEMLLQRVSECIGFQPDGYVLVDLDSFVSLVDIMGGVKFDVPQDMYYSDPTQDLYIDLKAGEQTLDGAQAMGLVRYRSGYAAADLQRVSVQREFVSAAAKQWMKPTILFKVPQLTAWLGENVETDLSIRNFSWIALSLMQTKSESITQETLPGSAASIGGVSYYVLDPYGVADLLNRTGNPYEYDLTAADLSIRN